MLNKWGADVVGVNCGGGWGRVGEGGPAANYEVAEEMVRALAAAAAAAAPAAGSGGGGVSEGGRWPVAAVPVICQPNAGHPKRVGSRNIYMATEEYFLVYAKRLFKSGVRMVGGCCGTKPHHISQIASAARMLGGGSDMAATAAMTLHTTTVSDKTVPGKPKAVTRVE